jgi:hypothetical protein
MSTKLVKLFANMVVERRNMILRFGLKIDGDGFH